MTMDNFSLPPHFESRMRLLLSEKYAEFREAYGRPLTRGLRVNTLKILPDRFQALFPLPLTPVPFSPAGFAFDGSWKAGADPLHHAGAYYMQEPSAMSAAAILDVRPGERVLDLCAAPGGKSTQLAAALGGRGLLWSNEYVRTRVQALEQNLERCGVRNAVISSCDASILCEALEGWFDAVLVDAPCSGEGMFRKEPAALEGWSMDNIQLCAQRQRDILSAAAVSVRPGGRLVYSTCTFAPEENECMAAWFLLRHPDFELEDISVSFGRPALSAEQVKAFAPDDIREGMSGLPLERCRRVWPMDGGEGHFIALFRRAGDAAPGSAQNGAIPADDEAGRAARELYDSCFSGEPDGCFRTFGSTVRLLPCGMPEGRLPGVLKAGVAAADVCRNRLEPCHSLFMAARADDCRRLLDLAPDDGRLIRFLRGEEIDAGDSSGWTAVAAAGVVTGFGKVSGGRLKNRYPKGLRLLG